MISRKIRAAILVTSAALGLGACTTYGGSLGYGGGYGYYGGGYAYSDYPYYGWYDDFYYPGSGIYIYDRGGHRHAWNDRQRHYWEGRRGNNPGQTGDNWSGYRGNREAWRNLTPEQRQQWQQQRGTRSVTPEQRQAWRDQRAARVTQQQQQQQQQSTTTTTPNTTERSVRGAGPNPGMRGMDSGGAQRGWGGGGQRGWGGGEGQRGRRN